MIRKIILLFATIFTLAWFVSAYLIKARVALLIENLEFDNAKISYNKINVTGFPNVWKIKIKDFKIKPINQINSKELSVNELEFIFDLSFKKAQILFSGPIKQEQDFGDQKISYFLNPTTPLIAYLKFNKPFYKVTNKDSFNSITKMIYISNNELKGVFEGNEIFGIKDLSFKMHKTIFEDKEDTKLTLDVSYTGQNYLLGFNNANLNFEAQISMMSNSLSSETNPYKIIEISNLDLKIEDSKMALNGVVENYFNRLPQGQFSISLNNYHKIIDKLINQNFIVSKLTLKKVIAKSHDEGNNFEGPSQNVLPILDSIKFDLKFSENGIEIGSLNLLDFKEED